MKMMKNIGGTKSKLDLGKNLDVIEYQDVSYSLKTRNKKQNLTEKLCICYKRKE